jgi:hypothetical protein
MGILLLSGPALAETKTWIGNNGLWSYAPNWSPSAVPIAGDDVFLTQSGATNKSVTYRNTASITPWLNNLTIDASGPGNITLNQGSYSDPLGSTNEYIGYNGKGTHLQSIGTNNISNSLYLGFNPGSTGTYTLSGTGSLYAMNAFIGNNAGSTGTFTQSGGSFSAQNVTIGGGSGTNGTYNLQDGFLMGPTINLNTGGNFNQTGGNLWANTFNQNGGTVTGTLNFEGNYTYNGGDFNGRLVNGGTTIFNADFTAANGMENQGTVNIFPGSLPTNNWRNLTFNGAGLLNQGAFNMTAGTLAGSGPIVNDAWMQLNHVTLWGATAFTNNGILQVTNNLNFESGYGSTFVNNGELRLVYVSPTGTMPSQPMPMADLDLPGDGSLENNGVINLNGNVIHDGTLNNNASGIINGNGYIISDLVNAGVINMGGGMLNISNASTNTGTINLNGTLFGGTITNNGTIEGGSGGSTVGNNLINHGMFGVGGGGKVTMTGALANASDGLITVRSESKLTINQGLAQNAGVITNSGFFDNNGHTLANSGKILSSGLFSTGGLTNLDGGKIEFTGAASTITGDVTNNSGGSIVVEYNPAVFTGNIVNNGTFKVTGTHFTCLGTFTGDFDSDPADNYFTDLIVGPENKLTGTMVGDTRDRFFISNDFINQSQQNLSFNTVQAYLAFTTGTDTQHQFYLPGADLSGSRQGFENNFAWGTLDISGQQVYLQDGNDATRGGAQYVGLLLGAMLSGGQVTNIFGADGLDIYYDPLLAGNTYLHGGTYGLMGGGFLAPVMQIPLTNPVPLPPTLWMVLSGLAGLGLLRRSKVHKG